MPVKRHGGVREESGIGGLKVNSAAELMTLRGVVDFDTDDRSPFMLSEPICKEKRVLSFVIDNSSLIASVTNQHGVG